MGSSIGDMEIDSIRDLAESRICSALGVPPILVGAKVGLNTATYSNYAQAKESFWEETLLPLYKRIEDSLNRIILPEMPSIANTEKIVFDFSEVRALQDDETDLWNRNLTKAKIAKELVMAGYDPLESLGLAGLEQINYVGMPKTNQPPTLLELETPKLKSLPDIKQIPSPDKERLTTLARRITEAQIILGNKLIDEIVPEMDRYFIRLLNRADSVIGRSLSMDNSESKSPTPPFNANNLIPVSADVEIQTIMRPIHLRVIESTFSLLNKELGPANAIPFDQALPSVQQFLVQGGTRIKDINNTTRKNNAGNI